MTSFLSRPYVILAIQCFLFYGFFLVSDGLIRDDVFVANLIETDRVDLLHFYFTGRGLPVKAVIHHVLSWFDHYIFFYKLTSFIGLYLMAVGCFKFLRELNFLERQDTLLVTVLFLAFPVYSVLNTLILVPTAVSLASFFFGMWAWVKYSQTRRWNFAVTGIILLLVSYMVFSLCLFQLGLMLGLFLLQQKKSVKGFLKTHWPVILLPFIYYFAHRLLFPLHQFVSYYNQFIYSPVSIISNIVYGLAAIPLDFGFTILKFVVADPVSFVIILIPGILSGWILVRLMKQYPATKGEQSRHWKIILWFAIFLLVVAILPYVMVDKPPRGVGFKLRHAMLMGLPVALILWSLFQRFKLQKKRWLFIVLAVFGLINAQQLLLWHNKAVKTQAMVAHLAEQEPVEDLVVIDDQADIGLWGVLASFETAWLAKSAWNNEDHLCIPLLLPAEGKTEVLLRPGKFIRILKNSWQHPRKFGYYHQNFVIPETDQLMEYLDKAHWPKTKIEEYRKILMISGTDQPNLQPYRHTRFTNGTQYPEWKICWNYFSKSGTEKERWIHSLLKKESFAVSEP